MKKQKKDVLKNCFVLFALFFSIAFLFPYTGDDWTWGSDAGMKHLETYFADLNGRYLGNLLVLALTRSKLLDALVMAVSYVLVCFLCYDYSGENACGGDALWLAAMLFFVMPKEILTQTIVWTSGFSNYVPSTLITAAFLCSVRKIMEEGLESTGRFSVKKVLWMFLLGFSGALFVENITVFNIGFALLVVIYTFLRFKKLDSVHLSFFLGSVVGACVMFSNSAYYRIMQGEDLYRNTPNSIAESIEMILEHAADILNYILYENLLVCGMATVLLVLLGAFRKLSEGKKAAVGQFPVIGHLACFLMILCKDSVLCLLDQLTRLSKHMELLFEISIALLYVFSIFLVIWCYVENGRRILMLLPLCCVAGSLMPLLVVNPIGARCVFVGYFFMMVFLVDLIGYLNAKVIPEEKWLSKLTCLVALMQAFAFLNIFYPVYCCESFRTDFIKRQAEAGEQLIYTCKLPNSDYLWNGNPTGKSLSKRYSQFHNLEPDTEFAFISIDELEALSESFN